MRRKLTVIAAALVAMLAIAGVAFAQEDEAEAVHPNRPRAALTASGDGTANLDVERGGLRIYLVGDVTIEGPANLDVRIESYAGAEAAVPENGSTTIVLTGFSGSVFVRGVDYTVEIDGHMTFHGHGQGSVSLDGTGLWKTRNDKGVWPQDLGLDS